jgi:hypothetical protein
MAKRIKDLSKNKNSSDKMLDNFVDLTPILEIPRNKEMSTNKIKFPKINLDFNFDFETYVLEVKKSNSDLIECLEIVENNNTEDEHVRLSMIIFELNSLQDYLKNYRVLISENIITKNNEFKDLVNELYYEIKINLYIASMVIATKQKPSTVQIELNKRKAGRPKKVNKKTILNIEEQAVLLSFLSENNLISPLGNLGVSKLVEALQIGSSSTFKNIDLKDNIKIGKVKRALAKILE